MKIDFRNFRSILTQVYFNWKRSEQIDKDYHGEEYHGPIENVFASNFVNFCGDNIPVVYMYCACVKFDFLETALATMPDDAQHHELSKTRIYSPSHNKGASPSKAAKHDRSISDAMNKKRFPHWV